MTGTSSDRDTVVCFDRFGTLVVPTLTGYTLRADAAGWILPDARLGSLPTPSRTRRGATSSGSSSRWGCLTASTQGWWRSARTCRSLSRTGARSGSRRRWQRSRSSTACWSAPTSAYSSPRLPRGCRRSRCRQRTQGRPPLRPNPRSTPPAPCASARPDGGGDRDSGPTYVLRGRVVAGNRGEALNLAQVVVSRGLIRAVVPGGQALPPKY